MATTEAAIERYFENSSAFLSTMLLEYHYLVADSSTKIYPTGTAVWSNSGDTPTLISHAISTTTNTADVSINYVVTLLFERW